VYIGNMNTINKPPHPINDPVGWMAKLSGVQFVLAILSGLVVTVGVVVFAFGGFEPTANYIGVAVNPTGTQCSKYVYGVTPAFTNWVKLPVPQSGWKVYANQVLLESDTVSIETPYGVCDNAGSGCCQKLGISEVPLPTSFVRQSTNSLLIGGLSLAGGVVLLLILLVVLYRRRTLGVHDTQ
jgi:hypothetical protein